MAWQDWIRTVEVEPAFDAARAAALERQLESLMRCGCRVVHVNGGGDDARHGIALFAPIIHRYDGVVDVHVSDGNFVEMTAAGADSITFDAAAVDDVEATIARARENGVQVGVAFDAGVTPRDVAQASAGADLVLCVCDGEPAIPVIRDLAAALPDTVAFQVEGDVTHDNAGALYRAGARLLVADRAIFQREDLPRAYRRLVQALA